MATGVLLWPPETALDAPINQISMAVKAHYDHLRRTNPWGSGKDPEAVAATPAGDARHDDPDSGTRFFHALRSMAKPLPKRPPRKEAARGR